MLSKAPPKGRRCWRTAHAGLAVCVTALCAVAVPAPADASTLVGDYTFQDTLASSGAGAPLTEIGSGTNTYATETVAGKPRTVLRFPAANGVRFTTGGGLDEYTLVLLMRFESMQNRYARVTDTSNRTRDEGLYFQSGRLHFYPFTPGSTQIADDEWVKVGITRDSLGRVQTYVNGQLEESFDDSTTEYAKATDSVNFFVDEANEHSAGAVSRIRVFDGALSSDEMNELPDATDAPTGLASTPAGPANDNTPRITGAAPSGSTIRVYTTSDCSGEPAASGSAGDFASPGLEVSVANGSTTTFRATAAGAGGTSACSTSSVSYREETPAQQRPPESGERPALDRPGEPPSITGLTVARRCVRSVTLTAPKPGTSGLSFGFSLSQNATVRYAIYRRNGSPRWSSCPRRAGTNAGRYTGVANANGQTRSGQRNTKLANTASRSRVLAEMGLGEGRRRVALARIAAGQKLAPGTYILRMTATNTNGQSTQVTAKFWVVGR